MGKTLEECYEVLGLEYGATEGNMFEKCDDLPAGLCVNFHAGIFTLSRCRSQAYQSNSYM